MATKPKSRGPMCTSPYTDGKTEPMRALPASWYTSNEMYELERRAIFSKKWMLVTHQVRIPTAGDWVKFETAGYEYVISRDRKGDIHAFHNICRHRAYPVLGGKESSGRNQILQCKYHGWTYALDGKLTKAPWYDDMQNFDRSKNGLFKVHLRVDALGFIWINLDSSETPEPWEKEFDGIDTQERYAGYNLDEYAFDHEFAIEADTNWKLCSDNFNECYHCPTAHPTIPTLFDVETLTQDSKDSFVVSVSAQNEEQKRDGLRICTTYYFPNCSTNILPNYIMLQRFLPLSANKTKMHYQIFRHRDAKPELFKLVNDLYVQVMTEDKDMVSGVQRNLQRGLFVNGELHSRVESAALHTQAKTREAVMQHRKMEEQEGRKIWPAVRTDLGQDQETKEDEEFCASLTCGDGKEALEW